MKAVFKYANHIRIAAPEPERNREVLLSTLRAELENLSANDLQMTDASIHFRGGAFRCVGRSNLLGPITTGDVTVKIGTKELLINYTITFTQLIVIVTVFAMLAVAIELAHQNRKIMASVLIIWICLIGVNVLLGITRFRDLIEKVARQAGSNNDA